MTFTALYPGLRIGAVVALDSNNNVLGTTYISGTGSGGLGVLVPGTMHTVAGDGDWQDETEDDKPAIFSELFLPSAVALDGAGNLYIADSNHDRIRMVCAAKASAPSFPGITCTAQGYIYTAAGVNGTSGSGGDGQPSTSSSVELHSPSGLAIDGAGNLYIADTDNHAVRKISAANGTITTIAGTGVRGYSGDGGAATSAQLYAPTGVSVDLSGNVFIADSRNNRIRAICGGSGSVYGVACTAGNIVTVAGGGTSLGDGGAATAATLARPYTMTLDAAGNMYIADSGNNRIRVVCAGATTVLNVACSSAGIIRTVAGNGTGAFKGDNGLAINAELFAPSGVAVDPAGNLYIADTQNFYVRKVNLKGIITSVAGIGGGSSGGDNGPANAAGLNGPYGLALDPNGNLFVAEYIGNRIRQIQANLSVVPVKTVIRQGSTSTTTNVAIENDGTGALDLTSITAGTNASLDAGSTCSASTALSVDARCTIGAIFAPANTPVLTANQAETGDITVTDEAIPGIAGANSPLDIRVTGTAAPVNSTTVTLASMPNPSAFAQAVTFTATVTTGQNTGAFTGTMNFYNGTTKIGAAVPVNSSGIATFTTTSLPVGADTITAAYNEDGKDTLHFSSTSDPLIQVVNAGTVVSLTSLPNPSSTGQAVTFTATVTASTGSGVTPDGTVDLVDGTNTIASVTLTAGVATFSISTLTDGRHQMTAVYLGDSQQHPGQHQRRAQTGRIRCFDGHTYFVGAKLPLWIARNLHRDGDRFPHRDSRRNGDVLRWHNEDRNGHAVIRSGVADRVIAERRRALHHRIVLGRFKLRPGHLVSVDIHREPDADGDYRQRHADPGHCGQGRHAGGDREDHFGIGHHHRQRHFCRRNHDPGDCHAGLQRHGIDCARSGARSACHRRHV